MISGYFGLSTTLSALREQFPASTRGTSVAGLIEVAASVGLQARAFRTDKDGLCLIKLPCVIHWDLTHFVVLVSAKKAYYRIHDPGIGPVLVGESEFWRRFTGIAVELSPSADAFVAPGTQRKINLSWLLGALRSQKSQVGSILLLAIMLEMLMLLAPLMLQIATDSIIPASDVALLYLVGGGLLIATLVQALIAAFRRTLLIQLSEALTVAWNGTVCARLLHRPYDFFVRRSIGDIHARFGSIEAIRRTLSSRLIEYALDGFTTVATLIVIVFYSPALAALTLTFAFAYATVRLVTLESIGRSEKVFVAAEADQQSLLLEILHGIQSIKVNGKESVKHARFVARTAIASEANSELQGKSALIHEIGQTILRVHRIAAVFAGTLLALEGKISPGMLVAYVTYGLQFLDRSARLLDVWADVRMLSVHVERLNEVVDASELQIPSAAKQVSSSLGHGLMLRSVSYRYGREEPFVLEDVALEVLPGECIAICGASGSGKSTMAKLIVGLLEPEHGVIELGGSDLRSIPPAQFRREVGCVLQDDQLFTGSIAENIAFFEPNYDRERVRQAAVDAQIDSEIAAMPMGYDTFIIDRGASLSGGQRQRLILARALYRQPKVLLLDEATSHLDVHNEELVNQALSSLLITRILIAHRPQTLAIASRVFELRDGKLMPVHREDGGAAKPASNRERACT
jgi:ATP-binding cassette subfamily B protein RaxB